MVRRVVRGRERGDFGSGCDICTHSFFLVVWDGADMAELTIEQIKTVQYSRKLQSSLQQTASRLKGLVTIHTGIRDKLFEIPKIGKRSLSKSTGGKDDTPDNANTFSKRWMSVEWWEDGYVHDRQINLESQHGDQIITKTQEAQLAACERTIDARIVEVCLGTALDGENGTNKAELPNSQRIVMNAVYGKAPEVPVDTGLTFDKIRLARAKLVKAEAMKRGDKAIFLVSINQLMELLGDEKATNAQYAAVKALIDGDLKTTFMGFEWVQTEHLPYDAEKKKRTCVAYVKEAVDFAFWEDSRTEITIRTDKKNCTQIYTVIGLGGTRSEDMGVVAVECYEEPDAA